MQKGNYGNSVQVCEGEGISERIDSKYGINRRLIELSQSGTEEAESATEQIVLLNRGLVRSIALRFRERGVELEDLIQIGTIGLIKAIRSFDLERGTCFSTYAVPMIIGEIRRYQRDNNAVRVSRGMRDLAYRALQTKEEISGTQQREATIAEIAERLGATEKAVGEAMEAIVEPISLFDSVYGDGEDKMYVIDKLSDEEESDESWVESISLKEAMKRLSPREMGIIERRFYKGRTQMEIAAEIGISQAQVSRLEKGAIDKLRKYMS